MIQKSECPHPTRALAALVAYRPKVSGYTSSGEPIHGRGGGNYITGKTKCLDCGRVWGIVGTRKLFQYRLDQTRLRLCSSVRPQLCVPGANFVRARKAPSP